MSVRWRLTIFNALIILAIEVLLVGLALVVAYRGVSTSVEESVERRASQVSRLLETEVQPDDPALRGYVDEGYLLLIRDGEGNVLTEIDADPARYDTLSENQREALWRQVVSSNAVATANPRELYGYGVLVNTGLSSARVVEVWRSYDEAANDIVPFLPVVTFAIPLTIVLAIGGSYLKTRSALDPVNAILRKARRISEDDLSQRLPVKNPGDEFGRLQHSTICSPGSTSPSGNVRRRSSSNASLWRMPVTSCGHPSPRSRGMRGCSASGELMIRPLPERAPTRSSARRSACGAWSRDS